MQEAHLGPLRDDIVACKLKIAVLETGQRAIQEQVKEVDNDVMKMKLDLAQHMTKSNLINSVIIVVATTVANVIIQNILKPNNKDAYAQDNREYRRQAAPTVGQEGK